MSRDITASCHCGAVELTATLRGDELNPARCTCSFCMRRQAANVSVDTASVRVTKGADALSMYQFGTKTARHYFCRVCGIYTHHQRYSDPTETGVNIGCVDGEEVWTFASIPWNDGLRDR